MKYLLSLLAMLFLTACSDNSSYYNNYSSECIAYAAPYKATRVYETMLEGCKTREFTNNLIKEMTANFCN